MAKERSHSPLLLFLAAALLLAGGWLMASFPVFIFIGLAPLFALTDRATDIESVWEKMEWVLFALVVAFLAARGFDLSFLVSSLAYAILFTLPFIGHVWVRQTLGHRAGKITIVLFWLAFEYGILKVFAGEGIFLSDALRLQPDWMRWNIHTGYLGGSAWILITNLMVYQAFLGEKRFQWSWTVLAVILLTGPVAGSYRMDARSITHDNMMNLYTNKVTIEDVTYLAQGELVVRTAAWLSILMLLFTFVKSHTTR
jgi:apolipoprotein N-acyltransferase